MKIGIVTGGNENLWLFSFLAQKNNEYIVYYDSAQWPYGDKDFAVGLAHVRKGIDYLLRQGCTHVIVSPLYELVLSQEEDLQSLIIPLFSHYLAHCFSHSLVGKVGVLGTYADLQNGQNVLQTYADRHVLTPKQSNTKSFHASFAWWTREVSLRNYLLRRLSPRQYMVNTIIKHDLRYFKDAAVDTILPLQYNYFAFEKIIARYFGARRYKFHPMSSIASCFAAWYEENKEISSAAYTISLHATGSMHMLTQQKHLLAIMTRGGQEELVFVE